MDIFSSDNIISRTGKEAFFGAGFEIALITAIEICVCRS
jgi:hypothetical protein